MNLHLRWDTRGPRWWTNRLRPRDSHQPNVHNIYALPTKAGWMMAVTVCILLIATINYQLNLGYVLIFLLLGSSTIGLYLAYREMTSVTLTLNKTHELRGFVGENVEINVDVKVGAVNDTQSLSTRFQQEGEQPFPLIICETPYPLGLLRLWTVWRLQSPIQIDSPRQGDKTRVDMDFRFDNDAKEFVPDGEKNDIRAYRLGDAPRDLLWKTVAKMPDTPDAWCVRSHSEAYQATQISWHAMPLQSASLTGLQEQRRLQQAAVARDLWLLGVLLFIALPFFLHLSWWYAALTVGLISWRSWQIYTTTSRSPKWFQMPLIAALGGVIWLQFHTFNGIEAGVSACIGLLGIKALELPNSTRNSALTMPDLLLTRDHWVLIYLGLFTLAAHLLLSQSIFSSVLVVLGLMGLLYILVLSHSKSFNSKAARTTLGMVVLGTPIMVVLFFLFPRFTPLWALDIQKNTSFSALSNDMRVGDISQIALDNRIVLRLEIDSPNKLESKYIYLRGPVLPRFDGRTWTTYQYDARRPRVELDVLTKEEAPKVNYTIMLEDSAQQTLPAPVRRYHGATSLGARNDVQSTSPAYLQIALSIPANSNPRTRQWAQTLRSDERYKNYAAQDWSNYLLHLLSTGGYRYTLAPGAYGVNVTDELLFDRKLGFCEHYASAYATAMRLLGFPARVVTGYQGAETNPLDGLQVVRNSNAHAWVEYWDGESSWVRVDPTAVIAPARIQNAQSFNQTSEQLAQRGHTGWSSGLLAPVLGSLWRIRQSWEATNHAWDEWFFNYNQGAQMNLLKKWGVEDPNWKDLVQLLDMILVAVLCVGALIYTLRRKTKEDPWLTLLKAARDRVLAWDSALPEHVTPRQVAGGLPPQLRDRQALQQWLAQLEALRYGDQNGYDLGTLKRSFKRLFKAPT